VDADDLVQRILTGVPELARQDPSFAAFGAKTHRYQFRPALAEAELVRFEQELAVRMPDDYRAFLTRVGNGGAGPSYGVMPFRGGDGEDYTKYEAVGHPFAYADAFNPTGLISDDGDAHDYWKAFDDRGAIYICHHGCGSRSMLVITGPCRGQVWNDGVADEHGFSPALDASGGSHSFASWYLDWLAAPRR
jgi:hypothetical protein